ncbi:MAG: hypothetical protein L0216_04685 [Planctomycetales bacterium]|nr:hypothetical protein [Planctomycetales bacterium]
MRRLLLAVLLFGSALLSAGCIAPPLPGRSASYSSGGRTATWGSRSGSPVLRGFRRHAPEPPPVR